MSKKAWKAWIIVAAAAAFVALLLTEGLIERPFLSTTPVFHWHEGDSQSRTFVIFPPTQVSGEMHTAQYLDIYLRYGNVLIVDPNDERFFAEDIAKATADELHRRNVKEIVIVGWSVGGQLNAVFRRHLAMIKSTIKTVFTILGSAPTGKASLVSPEQTAPTDFWYPGVGQNPFSGVFWQLAGFSPASRDESVDPVVADEHIRRSSSWPLSVLTDQGRAVVRTPPPLPGEFSDAPLVYLYSAGDGVVNESSIPEWQAAYGADNTQIVRVDNTPHVELVLRPATWRLIIKKILAQAFAT